MTVEIVEAGRIWDKAPHNAFTDLLRWQDAFYCAFREGRGHVSTDGRIRILESKDADTWVSAAAISLQGYDLRDAHLSVAPDDRLMLLGGAAPREKDNQSAPTGTFVSFSKDGRQWTEPQIAVEPGRWLWCVTWHKGKAYGVSYTAGKGDRYLDLLVSDDGIHYTPHVPRLLEQGYPTEVTLRFDSDETCYALVRRDRHGDDPSTALLGISKPEYKQWQWKDLGPEFNGFGGPNFIQIPGGHWLAAGRMHDGGAHTATTYLDVENGAMTKLAKLPSGGDTSYPGMVWHNNMLYVSYYSSHEAKTSIYLAKLRVTPKSTEQKQQTAPVKSFLDAKAILAGWENSYGSISSMRVSYSNELVDYKPPSNNPNEPLPVKYEHVERVEKKNRFHIRLSTDEDAFDRPQNLREHAFDGEITREYSAKEKLGSIVAGLIGRNTEIMNNPKEYMLLRRRLEGGRNASGTYLIEDPNSKPELSRTLSSAIIDGTVSVRPVLESVAGRLCHVVEVVVPGRDYKGVHRQIKQFFWMAHDNGMCLMKYQWFWDDTLEREIEVEQIAMTKMDGADVWYPKKAYKTIFAEQVFGTAKYELTVFDFVPNVEVDENTFRFDFPPGTDVMDKIRGVSGVDLPKELPSLVGKSLPSLDDLNIELNADQVKDKIILVCFLDMNQRPSWNCITRLAKQAEKFNEKGVDVFAIHASKVDENTLDEWIKKNNIPFPVGMLRGDEKKIRFNWGVKSLPWLILTDRKHIVCAEGFGLDKLDDKIRQTDDGK